MLRTRLELSLCVSAVLGAGPGTPLAVETPEAQSLGNLPKATAGKQGGGICYERGIGSTLPCRSHEPREAAGVAPWPQDALRVVRALCLRPPASGLLLAGALAGGSQPPRTGALSGGSSDGHTWGRGSGCWHLSGRGQGRWSAPPGAQDGPTGSVPASTVPPAGFPRPSSVPTSTDDPAQCPQCRGGRRNPVLGPGLRSGKCRARGSELVKHRLLDPGF